MTGEIFMVCFYFLLLIAELIMMAKGFLSAIKGDLIKTITAAIMAIVLLMTMHHVFSIYK